MLLELDLVSPYMQGVSFLALLVALITCYIKAYQQPQLRRFWLLFAIALTMNFAGNISWIFMYTATGDSLNVFTIIDLFYVTSYLLIANALIIYPTPMSQPPGSRVAISMTITALTIGVVYFLHILDGSIRGTFISLLMYCIYPVLDVGLIALAWLRYNDTRGTPWAKISLMLALAMTSYGLADSIELVGYLLSPILDGFLQNIFWMLRHLLILSMTLIVKKASDVIDVTQLIKNRRINYIEYFFNYLTK